MGLDCTHDAWHGAYSAFDRFRKMLWDASGGELGYYERSEGINEHGPACWAQEWPESCFEGEWAEYPEDPLLVLMIHSDCGGAIKHDITLRLAERLEELAPLLPAYGAGHLSPPNHPRERAFQFARGLREAHAEGEDLRFG